MDARARIEALAADAGFDRVRFAGAETLEEARTAARAAREEGRLADLRWMTDGWIDRAADPDAFLAGARTVALFAVAAHAPDPARPDGRARGRIARYARGRDYHRLFEPGLRRIARAIREELGGEARATVDYGPLLERPLAARAGLGWLGKSTMLLAPGLGPWALLGAVATTLEIAPDAPLRKSCGSCTRCIVACPTGAIAPDGGELDARLCISYHTIESRAPIPRTLRPKFGDWIFGCDDCLNSCPVGARGGAGHPDLAPASADDAFPPLAELLALDEAAFRARFRGRAIRRATRDGFLRNVCVALGNVGAPEDADALERALADGAALVRGHAAWALGEIARRHGIGARAAAALGARLAVEPDDWAREELAAALAVASAAGGTAPAPPVTPASAVTLREITQENLEAVLALSVRDSQRGFVATNERSLAQAHFEEAAWFRAVYADGAPVGFVMLHDESLRAAPRERGYLVLWRMMIDARFQGMGFGRRAIALLIAHARTRPHVTRLRTSWRRGEGSAEGFYRKLGFTVTGIDDGGEVWAQLDLRG